MFPLPKRGVAALSSLLILTGCSLPRIITLKDPLTVEEHLRLGAIYESRRELDLALKEYHRAFRKDPRDPRVMFSMGNVYLAKDQPEKARTYYKRAIDLNPSWPPPYNNLALVLIKEERLKEAEIYAKKALELNPENPAPYLDTLGVVYMKRGEYEKAERYFLKALERAGKEGREEIERHLRESRDAQR